MHEEAYWSTWVLALKRRGLNAPAAVFLEGLGPLSVFLAQVVYIGQPFLKGFLPGEQMGALARMLEDQQQRSSFAAFLEEDKD